MRLLPRLLVCALPLLVVACAVPATEPAATTTLELASWRASYAALADERVPPTFDEVRAGLVSLHAGTLPHEAKALRKRIGVLRDYIDIFAAAYDKRGPGDPFDALREDIDDLYERVGEFKDLFDAQGVAIATQDPATGAWGDGVRPDDVPYDPAEVAARLAKVLTARARFESRADAHRAYLSRADASRTYEHDGAGRFYWAGSGVAPSASRSGLENLSKLARALVGKAAKNLDEIRGLDEITGLRDHEDFHDLRKRVRAIVKLVDYFPELLEPGGEDELAVARELVERYGSLNDKILAHDLARERDRDAERKALAKEIEAEWKLVKAWQKQADAHDELEKLEKKIRKRG
jgi:hypothetical protein